MAQFPLYFNPPGKTLVHHLARAAPELVKAVVADALKRGLLLLSCGVYGNVLRLMVPLTIEQAVLDEGLDILSASIEAAAG